MEKLRRKIAVKKQKFPINAVTWRLGLQRITSPVLLTYSPYIGPHRVNE
jgi:hypothetical protein